MTSLFSRISILLVTLTSLALWFGYSHYPKQPLRIGINAWPGYEFLYLAQELNFYDEENVSVQIVEFRSLSDCRRAYERGQIDAMGATVIEVLQVREQSARSPQIVRVTDYSNGADVVLANLSIKSSADLKGKRVGVELASLGVYVLDRALSKASLTLSDVVIVSMGQSAMESAMRSGELDAIATYPPSSVRLMRDGGAIPIFSSADIPGEVVDVIAVEKSFNKTRPGDVAKMLRAFDRAVAYTNKFPAKAHRIMAKREGITPEEFASALMDGIKLVSAEEQAAYVKPGGRLEAVISSSDRILRTSGQMKGPDRTKDIVYRPSSLPRSPR